MAFARFLLVTALVSGLGGLFGASVGGLLGYAVPSSLSVFFGSTNRDGAADAGGTERKPDMSGKRVEVGLDTQKNMAGQGAAIGGALGLTIGAILGFILGIADQTLHVIRGLIQARKDGAHPAAAAGK